MMADRYMRYDKIIGKQVQLLPADKEKTIVLDETWEYIKVETDREVALYINDGQAEDEYILVKRNLELTEIGVRKVKLKLLKIESDEVNIQVILMK